MKNLINSELDSLNHVDLFVREIDKKLQPEVYDSLCSKRIKTLELWDSEFKVPEIEIGDIPEPFLNQVLRLGDEIINTVNKLPSGIGYTARSETKNGKERIVEANRKIEENFKTLGQNIHRNDGDFININTFSELMETQYGKIDKCFKSIKK